MKLRGMFLKKIDRDIKGVIKIGQDDLANVDQELEEYVVTRELSAHISKFFDAYKKGIQTHTDKMGVWISGFFGSGKSHFLKILSYLLENREVNGRKAISYFDEKFSDPMVLADMKMAGDVSADIILFNIDSKSDTDPKTNKEAILRVFNKVFNESQGFCGSLPWLAELERQMVKDGSYEDFKSRFKELAGSSWEDTREDFFFEEDSIVQALADTTKMSLEAARNWYRKAEENFSLSVEKFAGIVKDHIESKGGNHHIVFLVDEMGQYIGDDRGLILNLQTVTEDLGTQCGGKAWVIVTSQQDIDSVTRVRGNDFSKIQARFNTRLSLSSANVDEVIKRRLLYKNDVAVDTLKLLFAEKEAILKNLIAFSANTPEMKLYKDKVDFVEIYPFIPYQFRLLQAVFTAIRQHGASGKHLSEGERSLLSAFQEAAVKFIDQDAGVLIPFFAFYETIETFLDHNIRTVFMHAEDNEHLVPMDLDVLKVLFLIKWVKEMPTNLENIATLMVQHIDDDKVNLKKQIEESLDRLLKQTLIQKNGNEYVFLTHEEQDVNREIQNIAVDLSEIIQKIGEEIYSGIYSEKKFRYNARYHFDFNKVIDDRFFSTQKHEIGVKVLTPYYEATLELSDQALRMISSNENSVVINLPPDTGFLEEMENVLKIQTYLRRKGGTSSLEVIEEIKARKSREAAERIERVKNLLIGALGEADFYVNMQKLDLKSKNPVERINAGLKSLVDNTYSKLNYITEFVESNKDLHDLLYSSISQLKLLDVENDIPNKLALQEINYYIERNTQRHIPVTLKVVLDLFSKAPYGWLPDDIRGLLIKLFRTQEIKLQLGGDYLSLADKNLIRYLTKRDYTDRLLIKKRKKTPDKFLHNARDLIKELFNQTSSPDDEDGLMNRFKELAGDEYAKIERLLDRYEEHGYYPGHVVLEKGGKTFEDVIQIKDAMEFYEKLYEIKDELLDYEDKVFDVKKFFKNQRQHFDKAVKMLNIYMNNKTYVLDQETISIVQEIEAIIKKEKPYSEIPKLPGLIDDFVNRFGKLLTEECKPVRIVIENDWQKIKDELGRLGFEEELYDGYHKKFSDLLARLERSNNFYEAIAMKEESDRLKLRCFEGIRKLLEQREKEKAKDGQPSVTSDGQSIDYKPKTAIDISVAKIFTAVETIESEDDIDKLLEYVGKQLREQLKKDTVLRLV